MKLARVGLVFSGLLEEIALLIGVVFVTVAAWDWIGVRALVIPGVVLVWLALPSRAPLVERDQERRPRAPTE